MNDAEKAYIYALKCPISDQVVYVGRTANVQQRYEQHLLCEAGNLAKDLWISCVLHADLLPGLTILATTNRKDAGTVERRWIDHYSRSVRLLNQPVHKGGPKNPHRLGPKPDLSKMRPSDLRALGEHELAGRLLEGLSELPSPLRER